MPNAMVTYYNNQTKTQRNDWDSIQRSVTEYPYARPQSDYRGGYMGRSEGALSGDPRSAPYRDPRRDPFVAPQRAGRLPSRSGRTPEYEETLHEPDMSFYERDRRKRRGRD